MNIPHHVSLIIKRRKSELEADIENNGRGRFSQIATERDISKGALWKFIYTDYIPTSLELLRKLNIPEPILIYRTRNARGQFESYE